MFPENHLSSKFSTQLQAFLLIAIIAETNARFTFLPAKKLPQLLHFSTHHPARLHFTKIRLYLCSELFTCIPHPNVIALNAAHWCSRKEFLENTEGAIDPLSFYMYSSEGMKWHFSAFGREVVEEQQDSDQRLGNMLLKQRVNLLMRLGHRGEKKQASAGITEQSL